MAERTAPRADRASPKTSADGAKRGARPAKRRASASSSPATRRSGTPRVPQPLVRVIAVANQKGGVGKSTTAVSLGAALAELGKKVLVVDLDPQGNASTGLGIRHEAREVTVYDVLAAEAPIDGAIVDTAVENLFAIPSTIDLAGAEIELVSQFSRELRLRRALEPLKSGAYDFVFLDCPPSLGLLTVNALAAAEELIVPIQCEYYALEGLGQLLRNVRLVQQNVNLQLRLTGIVLTMFDSRTKLSEQVVEEVRRYFGDRVYRTVIPRTVRLSEAPGFGQPITVYDPRSKGAERYRELALEVIDKLPDDGPLPVIDERPSVVLPPPEPEPSRAPRPLVREDPEVERSLEEPTEDDQGGEPDGPQRGPEPEVTVEAAGSPSEALADGGGADEVSLAGPTEPPRSVEVESPPGDRRADAGTAESLERHADVEPDVEQARNEGSDQGADREVEEPSPKPEVEMGSGAIADEHAEPSEDEREPEDLGDDERAAPRRRWSLFRRGGDR